MACAIEQSATEWFGGAHSLVRQWFIHAVRNPRAHADVAKMLAVPTEDYVNNWLSRHAGCTVEKVQHRPYDSVGRATNGRLIRQQIKLRTGKWYMSSMYGARDFDMMVVFTPGPYFSLRQSTIRCIPACVLADPMNPAHMVRNADFLKPIFNCDTMTHRVLRDIYGLSATAK